MPSPARPAHLFASRRQVVLAWLSWVLLVAPGCASGTHEGEATTATRTTDPSGADETASDRDPSRDVSVALGVQLPPGTQQAHEQAGAGPEGASVSLVVLATRESEQDTLAFLRHLPGARDTRPGCVDVSGATVCVTPPERVPRTLFAPVRPVADAAPAWARAWIAVERSEGPPPCPPCEDGAPVMPGCSC
ncbi:MAG: hypothetical protein H6726_18015 [Sandaracinaceae bacterium]|nr:hypothetical protein [Sandaracinaceae bacterium]